MATVFTLSMSTDVKADTLELYPTIKRGDVVHINQPWGGYEIYIYDGEDMHKLHDEGRFPENMKVVTEFPIKYWHNSIEIVDGQWEVAFDFPLFRDQIVANLAAEENDEGDVLEVAAPFVYNETTYTLVFDRLNSWNETIKAKLIEQLDSGTGFAFRPYPVETDEQDYDDNTLYCVPDKDSWEELLDV